MASRAYGRLFRRPTLREAVQILAWVPVGILFTRHGYSVATVTGGSMQPTFNPEFQHGGNEQDVVLLDRWSIFRKRFRRGDVVTLWSPQDPNLLTTKRLVAVEGDLVQPIPPHSLEPVRIPPGHCWVEGDSRYQTRDSNTYGPISVALINARVTAILWPFSRYGSVEPNMGKARGRVHPLAETIIVD